MLNNSGEIKTRHSCLDPYFRGNAFRFSLLRIMFVVSLSYVAFFKLRQIPSMPIFWRVFIIKGCWILLKAFPASVEIIIWFLPFNLLIWCITWIDLCILKNPCIPGTNLTWSWCMIILMCCWILFYSNENKKALFACFIIFCCVLSESSFKKYLHLTHLHLTIKKNSLCFWCHM